MNSHDQGLLYACLTIEQRQRLTTRQIHLADIRDAMAQGFKPEPDLAEHHLPLLSDEALARVFSESEKWRDKTRERELEALAERMREDNERIGGYYVDLRVILGTQDVPHYFNPKPGKPKHIQYTEQRARALVANSENSERNRKAAEDAEARVDLLGRYVKACDEKRIPYNWNVFKLPTAALRHTVQAAEATERLTNCETDGDRLNHFAERKRQETEQSLRWHVKRHEAVRQLIHRMNNNGEIRVAAASELMDVLLDRPQTGEQDEGWTVWEWGYAPKSLNRDTLLELELTSGDRVTLDSSVVEWADVKRYRVVK
ncbi:hypothetical protein [Escherichia phage vB-Eco-KMB41]|nr:hypothetical protein [Escherichia phage vB-Eco-KMB41]